MEPKNTTENETGFRFNKIRVNEVTPFSKLLAMALFIIMPFVGGWIGYQYALKKFVDCYEQSAFQKGDDLTEEEKEMIMVDPPSMAPVRPQEFVVPPSSLAPSEVR